jgi:hypothetical protein
MKQEIKVDNELIAYCGLYCGACRKYLNDKCPGCRLNEKATWCKIRTCCIEQHYHTCAKCRMNAHDCRKFNNIFSKLFALIFKSDREACLNRINEIGEDKYSKEMAEKNIMTIKRNR